MPKSIYKIKSEVLVYPGMSAWRFLVIPKKESSEIKERFGKKARGWGSLKVSAAVGKTSWETSIFPDKKSGTYMLPLKAQIRRAEGIDDRDTVGFSIKIL
jgi:hypothetical protein